MPVRWPQLRRAAGLHHQCHHPAQKSWRV